MRRSGLILLAMASLGATADARDARTAQGFALGAPPPITAAVPLEQLQALSSREVSYPVGAAWSVDVGRDQGAAADAYGPGRPIDDAQPRQRLVLSLRTAKTGGVDSYIGAGVESVDYERFASARPFEPGRNQVFDFAATVVAGFNVDMSEGWKMQFKADSRKVMFGMRYQLN